MRPVASGVFGAADVGWFVDAASGSFDEVAGGGFGDSPVTDVECSEWRLWWLAGYGFENAASGGFGYLTGGGFGGWGPVSKVKENVCHGEAMA